MRFSESIPGEILNNPNTAAFVAVLDALQMGKQEIIARSFRVYNPLLCTDKKWLIYYLEDYGISGVPEFLPLVCLQQLALNADVILRLRGTLAGLKLLCEGVVLGVASFDISGFSPSFSFLLPNSFYDGFITDTNISSSFRYLVDRNDFNAARSLGVTLNSKVFNGISAGNNRELLSFLRAAIDRYLGFHPNCTITITTGVLSAFVYPQEFNNYFKE